MMAGEGERELTGEERAGIEAVARHYSATWEAWRKPLPGAYLTIGRKRITAAVLAIPPAKGIPGGVPRLRFDRVVLALARRLLSDLRELVPDGKTLMIAVTAPILQPGATAAAIVESLRRRLERRPARLELGRTLLGNGVRVSLVGQVAERVPKVILFVHDPDREADIPGLLFGLARALAGRSGLAPGRRKRKGDGADSWIVLVPAGGRPPVAALRYILSQLCVPAAFSRVLLVLSGGRVESLQAGP
jgi:hypothetical protein